MANYMNFQNNKQKNYVGLILIIILSFLTVGATLAFFFYDDWSSKYVSMSGKVLIEAVGSGDVSIEDTHTSNLVVHLDQNYTRLIPGMDVYIPANVKVKKSNSSPLLRARLDIELVDMSTMEGESEERVIQDMFSQLDSIIESNDWYLHSDSYYYYIGENSISAEGGGGTLLSEVEVTKNDVIVSFIDEKIKFPTYVTSDYSGLGVNFKIIFQGIQNYIPDEFGSKLPNTIDNSQKIFNDFIYDDYEETSVALFNITTENGKITIGLKEGVVYPETIMLPTYDGQGNPITNISSSLADLPSKKIVVPSGYTTIDEACFQGNTTIESIDLSRTSITVLPEHCFENSSIKKVELPLTLKNISASAFKDSQLSSIVLNDGLEEIHQEALTDTQISSIFIPASVNYISTYQVWISSPKLKKIMVDDNNPYFSDIDDICILDNNRFIKMAQVCGVTEFTIPEGIKSIEAYAFYNNATISKVNCPNSLTDIKDFAFRYCYQFEQLNVLSAVQYGIHVLDSSQITDIVLNKSIVRKTISNISSINSITFASNVTNIATEAIADCSMLKTIIFEGNTPPTFASSTFLSGNYPSDLKIYVPDSALSTYKAVSNLANYKNQIVAMSTLPV